MANRIKSTRGRKDNARKEDCIDKAWVNPKAIHVLSKLIKKKVFFKRENGGTKKGIN